MNCKRILTGLLAVSLSLSLTACTPQNNDASTSGAASVQNSQETETRIYTDSLGREVELPVHIDKVALSGPLAQIMLFPLCPDKMVGVASTWSEDAALYLKEEHYTLPEIGQLYGGKGALNLETLLTSGAQVVIDVGRPTDGLAEDLDDLQNQTGVPFVHIATTTEETGDTYRMLGELLDMETEAEVLAEYCDRIYNQTIDLMNSVEKVNALYITGEEGLNVIPLGSYHSEIIDLMTNNLAVVDNPSSKGTGNEVDMEQILLWNPDVIIFSHDSIYDTVADDPAWQEVSAIANGRYYEAPYGPYNWMGNPPSVQRYICMQWLSHILYPEATSDYDMYEITREYYELFYHCDLTQDLYDNLVSRAMGPAESAQ